MIIDKLDKKILQLLQAHGRRTNQDIAHAVGLSPAACLRRVRALEEQQIINGYSAQLNLKALGYDLIVYVDVALKSESSQSMEAFEAAIMRVDEVLECHLMSGDTDYKVKLAARDLEDYERLHRQVLANLPHVDKIKSSFSIRSVVKARALTLV